MGYPVMLNLAAQTCVVVGGGKIATRKIHGLLEAHAKIIVISPQCEPTLLDWAAQHKIEMRQQQYQSGMLAELCPHLVFAATNQPAVNQLVIAEAQALHIFVNAADDPTHSDFHNMAVRQRGGITVSVATNGAAPTLARLLGDHLAGLIGEEYIRLVALCEETRPIIQTQIHTSTHREAFWRELLQSTILDHLREGNETQAHTIIATLQQKWENA